MKVTRSGTVLIDTKDRENHLTLDDVKEGECFRFIGGSEKNVYIMGKASYFLISAGAEYSNEPLKRRFSGDSLVAVYSNAHLELGEERTHKPSEAK